LLTRGKKFFSSPKERSGRRVSGEKGRERGEFLEEKKKTPGKNEEKEKREEVFFGQAAKKELLFSKYLKKGWKFLLLQRD